MKKLFTLKEIIPIGLIIISTVIGLMVYPLLPQEVPSHWNANGIVDAWMGKNLAVLFFPLLNLFIYLLLAFMPFIDPLKKNYLKFAKHYFWFRTITIAFLISVYLLSLWVAVGLETNIIYFILPLFSIFFAYIGFFLTKVKRNYFVGIRTPWTIHSEKVWDKTHELGGKVMVVAGIISLLGIINIKYAFAFFLAVILIAACIPIAYSYYIFKKIEK